MAWIKRNLYFLIGGVIALALLGAAIFYLFTQNQKNNELTAKLTETYDVLNQLNQQNPHPGKGKVDNIAAAREQVKAMRGYMAAASSHFAPIAPIPAGEVVTDEIFAAQLRNSIEQMQRAAALASCTLPPRYDFSFSAIKSKISFALGSLNPLAQQLGEVKTICDVLFAAKINALDSIRRVRVSPDDKEMADYIEAPAVTNDLAIVTPYEVTFRCFSDGLAKVLTGFAYSPYGFTLKTVAIEATTVAAANPAADPYAQTVPVTPIPVPATPPPAMANPELLLAAPGFRPVPPPVQPVVAPVAVTTPVPGRGGLPTVLNEKPLRVTMVVELIKLLEPAKAKTAAQ